MSLASDILKMYEKAYDTPEEALRRKVLDFKYAVDEAIPQSVHQLLEVAVAKAVLKESQEDERTAFGDSHSF